MVLLSKASCFTKKGLHNTGMIERLFADPIAAAKSPRGLEGLFLNIWQLYKQNIRTNCLISG
ncbi:hypothetical protein B14911_23432 [Bacillus sp. NRRL B-14911]|nr:hypothetical protein B14911_23432 [Bacillus sp. NRRL B-14911]